MAEKILEFKEKSEQEEIAEIIELTEKTEKTEAAKETEQTDEAKATEQKQKEALEQLYTIRDNMVFNFTVISTVINCLSMQETVNDIFEEMDSVIQFGCTDRLWTLFYNEEEIKKTGVVSVIRDEIAEARIEQLSSLFGISEEHIIGEKRINLGIEIPEDVQLDVFGSYFVTKKIKNIKELIKKHPEWKIELFGFEDGGTSDSEDNVDIAVSLLVKPLVKYYTEKHKREVLESAKKKRRWYKKDQKQHIKDLVENTLNNPLGIDGFNAFLYVVNNKMIKENPINTSIYNYFPGYDAKSGTFEADSPLYNVWKDYYFDEYDKWVRCKARALYPKVIKFYQEILNRADPNVLNSYKALLNKRDNKVLIHRKEIFTRKNPKILEECEDESIRAGLKIIKEYKDEMKRTAQELFADYKDNISRADMDDINACMGELMLADKKQLSRRLYVVTLNSKENKKEFNQIFARDPKYYGSFKYYLHELAQELWFWDLFVQVTDSTKYTEDEKEIIDIEYSLKENVYCLESIIHCIISGTLDYVENYRDKGHGMWKFLRQIDYNKRVPVYLEDENKTDEPFDFGKYICNITNMTYISDDEFDLSEIDDYIRDDADDVYDPMNYLYCDNDEYEIDLSEIDDYIKDYEMELISEREENVKRQLRLKKRLTDRLDMENIGKEVPAPLTINEDSELLKLIVTVGNIETFNRKSEIDYEIDVDIEQEDKVRESRGKAPKFRDDDIYFHK